MTATFVLPDRELLFEETEQISEVTGHELYDVDSARTGSACGPPTISWAGPRFNWCSAANPDQLLEMFIQSKLQSLEKAEKKKLGLPVDDGWSRTRSREPSPAARTF